jgi:hypothetical protein
MRRVAGVIGVFAVLVLLAAALAQLAGTATAGQGAKPRLRLVFDVYDVTVNGNMMMTTWIDSRRGASCPTHHVGKETLRVQFTSGLPSRRGFRVFFPADYPPIMSETPQMLLLDVRGERKGTITIREGCVDSSTETYLRPCDLVGEPNSGLIIPEQNPKKEYLYRIRIGPELLGYNKCDAVGPDPFMNSRYFNARRLFSKTRFSVSGSGSDWLRDRDGRTLSTGKWIAHFCKRTKPTAKPKVCTPHWKKRKARR